MMARFWAVGLWIDFVSRFVNLLDLNRLRFHFWVEGEGWLAWGGCYGSAFGDGFWWSGVLISGSGSLTGVGEGVWLSFDLIVLGKRWTCVNLGFGVTVDVMLQGCFRLRFGVLWMILFINCM